MAKLLNLKVILACQFLVIGFASSVQAQPDIGVQLANLVEEQSQAEATAKKMVNDCAGTWDAVRNFIGPASDPLEPRDMVCKDFIASSGRRLNGFDSCSAKYFANYDVAHAQYRQCFDAQNAASRTVIEIHRRRLDLDRKARASARASGSAPATPNGERGWLGFGYASVTEDDMQKFGLDSQTGAIVTSVRSDSPASKAGLLANDIIVAVDSVTTSDRKAFARQTQKLEAGSIIILDVLRAGQRRFTYVAVEER